MAALRASSERHIKVSAAEVYAYIADYRQHHGKFLPPAFLDLTVEQGGVGAGTVFSTTGKLGGVRQTLRMAVTEPQPGRVLVETGVERPWETTFTVQPDRDGCTVEIVSVWTPKRGVLGLLERLFAPRMVRGMFEDELVRLERYALSLRQGAPAGV